MDKNRFERLKRERAGLRIRQRLEQMLFEEKDFPRGRCYFLDLEESDKVMRDGKDRFAARHLKNAAQENRLVPLICELQVPVEKLSGRNFLKIEGETEKVVAFLDSDKVGVLVLPGQIFCEKWADLIDIAPDGFVVFDRDLKHKMAVQVVVAENMTSLLDIGVWGKGWAKAFDLLV